MALSANQRQNTKHPELTSAFTWRTYGEEAAMPTDADTRYGTGAPSLVIISGNDSGRRIPLPSTGLVLGREGKLASLFRDDPLVSRGHAPMALN
jgi:hypothetical protein